MKTLVLAAALIAGMLVPAIADQGDGPVAVAVKRLLTADDPAIARALASMSPSERQAAAIVLGRRKAATPAQVDELVLATGDDLLNVRMAATRALGELGDAALPGAARLERLASWATVVEQRHEAALALARIPAARENLLRLFLDDGMRKKTTAGLATLGTEGRTALVLLSDTPQWRIRVEATAVLPDTKDADTNAEVAAALGRRLRDESSAVRVAALIALPRIDGSGMLTAEDVARVFTAEVSEHERHALLAALASGSNPEGSAEPDLVIAAALRSLESGSTRDRLTGVRLVFVAGTTEERALLALARIALSDDVASACEAAACLRHLGAKRSLPAAVADALRPATGHARARVACEAAAALALGGHDGPELAPALARLVYAEDWSGSGARPFVFARQRNLRAGGGRFALPAVPLLPFADIARLLRPHPDAAADALTPYVSGNYAPTRASAAWLAADICPAERARALLAPLLDDPDTSVRIVAGVRLAQLDAHTDRIARMFVEILLDDGLIEDPVIRADGLTDDLVFDDEMIAAIARDLHATVRALVAAHAARATVAGVGADVSVTWQTPSGDHHVRAILKALGPPSHLLLVNEILEGGVVERHVARNLLGAITELSTQAIDRLEGLRDHPDVGIFARQLVGD